MATASNPPTNNHSPRSSGGDPAVNSPKSRRSRGVSSPWTQIVRGESESVVSSPTAAGGGAAATPSSPVAVQEHTAGFSSESSPSKAVASASFPAEDSGVEAQAESSDNGAGNSNAAKKTAWNRPSNGAVDLRPVMGAVSWPALSESTKPSPKSSSSDSLKALPDGSVSASQGSGNASFSSQKQVITNNVNPISTPSNVTPTRHKSSRRGGSSTGSVSANGGYPQPQSPMSPVGEMPSNNVGKAGSVLPEASPRDHTHKESGYRGNDNPQQRNSSRRGNGGSHPRGDGSYHHHYGGKRGDHDRGNDWRSFSGRVAPMQPQRVVPRGFLRHPPHSPTAFVPPPGPPPMPVPPFGTPMVYPDQVIYFHGPPAPPESLRGVPIMAPMSFYPVPDNTNTQLQANIVNQIDYYFSDNNLIKDIFLRNHMDDQGWVSIKLIAGFNKVKKLTENVQCILDALHSSNVVEVQGDKVRRRNDWMRWIMPPVQTPIVLSPQSLGRSGPDMLAANLQVISLSRSSSGDSNSQLPPSSNEGFGQASFQASTERLISARSSSH